MCIRDSCKTVLVEDGENTSSITIISRISTENKQNAFEYGLNDQGDVANFVETEIVVTTIKFIFSYTQIDASVPLFWEFTDNQILYGRKVKMIKSADQSQIAFNKHFDNLESKYGVISILNLVKPRSDAQESLALAYKQCACLLYTSRCV